jgi:hypothetical protein
VASAGLVSDVLAGARAAACRGYTRFPGWVSRTIGLGPLYGRPPGHRCCKRRWDARVQWFLHGPGRQASPLPYTPARRQHGLRCCGATIAQVSGKSGGYYGCLEAKKGACADKTLVRRTLAEKLIFGAIQDQIADPEHRLVPASRRTSPSALRPPDALKLKEAELTAEQRRLADFVDSIGEGPGSRALAKALVETEVASTRWAKKSKRCAGASRRSSGRLPSSGQGALEQCAAGARAADRKVNSETSQPPRADPLGARHARHRPSLLPRRHNPGRPCPHRRTAPHWRGGRFEFFAKVETAGIEPASAIARKAASTSVAGTLISPSTRHAGGVVEGQLRKCPRWGWSGPHRVSLLLTRTAAAGERWPVWR